MSNMQYKIYEGIDTGSEDYSAIHEHLMKTFDSLEEAKKYYSFLKIN